MTNIAPVFFMLQLINGTDSYSLIASSKANWPTGYWLQIKDEDGQARDDTFQVLADGTVLAYDSQCREIASGRSHLYDGTLFVTWRSPKGPIAIAYVPSKNHELLTFTSPRTGNNAIYSRTKDCHPM